MCENCNNIAMAPEFAKRLKYQTVFDQLQFVGENPNREGLLNTPIRVVKMWDEIYSGYKKDPKDILTVFDSDGYDQIVLLKDFEFYSMCEHHMLPFYGKAHVAYIPNGKVIGISKLARLVDIFFKATSNPRTVNTTSDKCTYGTSSTIRCCLCFRSYTYVHAYERCCQTKQYDGYIFYDRCIS